MKVRNHLEHGGDEFVQHNYIFGGYFGGASSHWSTSAPLEQAEVFTREQAESMVIPWGLEWIPLWRAQRMEMSKVEV